MNTPALLAVVSLIQQITETALVLQSISDLIRKRQAAGQDVTLDDLKGLRLPAERSVEALKRAVEEAERQE